MRRPALAALLWAAFFCLLPACTPAQPPRYTVFAMEGPPLAIVGGPLDAAGEPSLTGRMDRACMVGDGEIAIDYPPQNLVCRGRLKDGPAENGRVRGIIPCTGQEGAVFLLLTLGQHGPDQGVGLARIARGEISSAKDLENPELVQVDDLVTSSEPPLLFFYHPWDQEAGRRFQEARENVLLGLDKKKSATD